MEWAPTREEIETFPCFGATCAVLVSGSGGAGAPREAVARTKRRLLDWHAQFSRFEAGSELSRLNDDPRATVPVSSIMGRFVEAALGAAELTGGLVDPTLVTEIEQAGYGEHFAGVPVPLERALALAPARAPGAPNATARWREVTVHRKEGTVSRPPGVRLDSGGIAKGMFGDVLATVLSGHESFAIDAGGDVRFGGKAALRRPVQVASPFDDSVLHEFVLLHGAAATSGIGKRSWLDRDGRPAHHLLDPGTGRPAFTGIVQVTALAPTATEAEALAKAAILAGPGNVAGWLPHGGLVVYDDTSCEVIAPRGA